MHDAVRQVGAKQNLYRRPQPVADEYRDLFFFASLPSEDWTRSSPCSGNRPVGPASIWSSLCPDVAFRLSFP